MVEGRAVALGICCFCTIPCGSFLPSNLHEGHHACISMVKYVAMNRLFASEPISLESDSDAFTCSEICYHHGVMPITLLKVAIAVCTSCRGAHYLEGIDVLVERMHVRSKDADLVNATNFKRCNHWPPLNAANSLHVSDSHTALSLIIVPLHPLWSSCGNVWSIQCEICFVACRNCCRAKVRQVTRPLNHGGGQSWCGCAKAF
mmetsp:Transcript_5223/g.11632  ORF Transcript_5223/g.11632 Transcript_5223/m.11632 type:complete len:203 (-) Transcript_5223:1061-1669(-)